MKNLILTLIITLPLSIFGQGWEQTYSEPTSTDDMGKFVLQTSDGGYIITGHTRFSGNGWYEVYLLKTDEYGNEEWSKTFGGIEEDIGVSIDRTNDGGYIITGHTRSYGSGFYDIYLIKTDGDGNEQWDMTFGGVQDEKGFSVKETFDNGFIVSGYKYKSYGTGQYDLFLVKTDINGNEEWSQTYGGLENERGESVQQAIDGGYIVTGVTESFGNGLSDVYLLKTDEYGNEQWSRTFGGAEADAGYSVVETNDGGFIITGNTFSYSNSNGSEIYLIKTDENGNEEWIQTFGDSIHNYVGYSIQQTSDNGYIITGSVSTIFNWFVDVYLLKIDNNGNEQWNMSFGGDNLDIGYSVQQTQDDGYIITGYTTSIQNNNSIYLIKTNQFGNITSTKDIHLPNSDRKLKKTVNLKGQKIKPHTNTPIIEIFDDGSVEKKVITE